MSRSFSKNYLHIVFSTKHRQPLIQPPFEEALHRYIWGICHNMDCHPVQIGGYIDHIHILCLLSKKQMSMKLIEKLKSHSSKWMKTRDESLRKFYWQAGYGSFSVSQREVDSITSYIANQHEHHRNITFQEEFRAILRQHDIEFDERYVWD